MKIVRLCYENVNPCLTFFHWSNNMKEKRVFVTVGTTKFEKLVTTASDKSVLDVLVRLGYTTVQFQTGNGKYEPQTHDQINLQYNKYFENFENEIRKSDLVVSHAGAGSCLQVLQIGKPLIVVVNTDLMDNHQTELAQQLQDDGYLYYCTCDGLQEILSKDFSVLRKYPEPNPQLFSNYLDKCIGFQ